MRERATEEMTLAAWANLEIAIKGVECALPSQMSQAIADLERERRLFEDLLLGRPTARKLVAAVGLEPTTSSV